MENNIFLFIGSSLIISFITFCIGYKLGIDDKNRACKEIR